MGESFQVRADNYLGAKLLHQEKRSRQVKLFAQRSVE
jgi:hypothetical protein